MLNLDGCRDRQHRFLAQLERAGVDAALISAPRDIYYFTGLLPESKFSYPNLLFLSPHAPSWLITGAPGGEAVVEEIVRYSINELFTLNPDNHRRAARLAAGLAERTARLKRLGFQREETPASMLRAVDSAIRPAEWVEIDETLQEQQLCKDADEIECLKLAIRANLAAYARAQQVIRPGISELEVLSQCQAAAQQAAGEPIYHNGDYRAGEFGGFARDRALQAGELYIIDAWSDVHGYWCDMARTWVVGGQPSPLQAEIYEHLAGVLRAVPELIRPGLCTRTFWTEIDRRLREHPEMREVGLTHHAGHGVGMRVHEGPDLNRDRGGFFAPGNVVTCEPGFYRDDLRRGIRLENVFLVTDTGAENLSDTPLSLVQQPQEPEFAVW